MSHSLKQQITQLYGGIKLTISEAASWGKRLYTICGGLWH